MKTAIESPIRTRPSTALTGVQQYRRQVPAQTAVIAQPRRAKALISNAAGLAERIASLRITINANAVHDDARNAGDAIVAEAR